MSTCHILLIPAMTIIPRNTKLDFEFGWKVKPDECVKSEKGEYLKCIEQRAYPESEIFVDLQKDNYNR